MKKLTNSSPNPSLMNTVALQLCLLDKGFKTIPEEAKTNSKTLVHYESIQNEIELSKTKLLEEYKTCCKKLRDNIDDSKFDTWDRWNNIHIESDWKDGLSRKEKDEYRAAHPDWMGYLTDKWNEFINKHYIPMFEKKTWGPTYNYLKDEGLI
uniref:Uncharacterized protein n=1 Tax=Euplotes crassus TaxID=5936 RepID=A0A7S3NU87_EUPCR|mmetsp:Transcript_20740/g.20479  ORF Transcript_20740/g.20479 Transcript_20740/m.20479 type:complete len:152 (+) Transcript_20740:270-725(+)